MTGSVYLVCTGRERENDRKETKRKKGLKRGQETDTDRQSRHVVAMRTEVMETVAWSPFKKIPRTDWEKVP